MPNKYHFHTVTIGVVDSVNRVYRGAFVDSALIYPNSTNGVTKYAVASILQVMIDGLCPGTVPL